MVTWHQYANDAACTQVAADGTQTRTLIGASGLLFDTTVNEDPSLPVVDVGLGATSIENSNPGSYTATLHLDLTVTGSNTIDVIVWWAASGDFDPLVEVASATVAVTAGSETVDVSGSLSPAESGVFFAVLEFTTGDSCSIDIETSSTFEVCGG